MRAVVQRVKSASVKVSGESISEISRGLLIFHGVAHNDTSADVTYLANKIAHLRIFEDSSGRMNRSLLDISGEGLVVSQFTLYGDCRKGRRPSFVNAAHPEKAQALYQEFIEALSNTGVLIQAGIFKEMMDIQLVNDGPVTILVDTTKLF